ncbi:MAG TPA: ParB/RepB/Spo0J family partition protein [Actinomycetota bacterium]
MAAAGAVVVTRKAGLGRGLDALLPSATGGELEERAGPTRVRRADIDPNPRQPRHDFPPDALAELAASITQLGILQPLLVRPAAGGRYELVAGERRLRAAGLAGLDEVPVVVVETDDVGSLERALVENVHRADLNPIEEAAAYRQLIDEGGLTQEALGERLGRNRVAITRALRLLDLPVSIQRLLTERKLTAGHGTALLGLEGSPFQERMARRAADEGLSVRDTEDLVRRYQAMTSTASSTASTERQPRPAIATDAQRRLADHLQTRVRVEMGKRKGRIVLDFVSTGELDRLLGLILGEAPGEADTIAPGPDETV